MTGKSITRNERLFEIFKQVADYAAIEAPYHLTPPSFNTESEGNIKKYTISFEGVEVICLTLEHGIFSIKFSGPQVNEYYKKPFSFNPDDDDLSSQQKLVIFAKRIAAAFKLKPSAVLNLIEQANANKLEPHNDQAKRILNQLEL